MLRWKIRTGTWMTGGAEDGALARRAVNGLALVPVLMMRSWRFMPNFIRTAERMAAEVSSCLCSSSSSDCPIPASQLSLLLCFVGAQVSSPSEVSALEQAVSIFTHRRGARSLRAAGSARRLVTSIPLAESVCHRL
eukprot:6205308-Pleurochrysis_carterae.AAC.2